MVGIDFTGGQALAGVIARCRADGVIFAVARLESLAAEAAFARMGLRDLIGQDHIFRSVAEALAALSEAAA
jgi:MFS superfamily sulfate permease-like transporter